MFFSLIVTSFPTPFFKELSFTLQIPDCVRATITTDWDVINSFSIGGREGNHTLTSSTTLLVGLITSAKNRTSSLFREGDISRSEQAIV